MTNAELEAAVATGRDSATYAELERRYLAGEGSETLTPTQALDRERFLAELAYARGNPQAAYGRLLRAANRYSGAATLSAAGLLAAEIAVQRLREPQTAELLFATLRDRYPTAAILDNIPEAYGRPPLDSLRAAWQQAIYATGFDRDAAERYGRATLAALAFSADSALIVRDRIASARVLEQANRYDLAVAQLDALIDRYPDAPASADARFLRGFVHLEHRRDTAAARDALGDYLARHPNHKLADDARALLTELSTAED